MKFNFKKIKEIILFFSLLFLTLYIPLSFTIYSNFWYEFNYNNQDTYNQIEKNKTINSTNNLINFFKHKEDLNFNWNEKEKLHMYEVRNIYDILFFIGIISIISLSKLFNFKLIRKFSKINLYYNLFLILLIPIFQFFWNKIFHLILFNNDLWIINSNDISYYLFPINFFINSLIFIILISIILNLILYNYKMIFKFLNKIKFKIKTNLK